MFKSINANQVRSINLLLAIFNFRPTQSGIRNSNIHNKTQCNQIRFSLWNVLVRIYSNRMAENPINLNVFWMCVLRISYIHCSLFTQRATRALIFVFRIVLQFSGVQSIELCTKPNLNINCVSVWVYLFDVGIEHVRNGGKKGCLVNNYYCSIDFYLVRPQQQKKQCSFVDKIKWISLSNWLVTDLLNLLHWNMSLHTRNDAKNRWCVSIFDGRWSIDVFFLGFINIANAILESISNFQQHNNINNDVYPVALTLWVMGN